MPELPDITMYIEALERKTLEKTLENIRIKSAFLLRSVEPPISSVIGQTVRGYRRLGKRIIFEFDDEIFLVLHLMIAGRIRWKKRGAKLGQKAALAAFDFPDGSLVLTEASTRKRASLYVVQGDEALAEHDRGGIDIMSSTVETFTEALQLENHTIKRSLTDPRFLSGIGNSYSDEILHRAKMSPFKQTKTMKLHDFESLYEATLAVIEEWTVRFRDEMGDGFPDKVTAFRPEMAVHGKYKEPCPVCGKKIQRIRYACNEANYCAECQTGGKLLADRSLSRLLKKDWPKTLEDLEQHMADRKLD